MDRNTVLAFVIIGIIILLTPYYMERVAPPKPKTESTELPTAEAPAPTSPAAEPVPVAVPRPGSLAVVSNDEKTFTVTTDLYQAVISNKNGGSILSFKLNRYTMFDTLLVNLVDGYNQNNLVLSGKTIDGDPFVLDNFWHTTNNRDEISLGGEPFTVTFTTALLGGTITKSLTFHPDNYRIDVNSDFTSVAHLLSQGQYLLAWNGGLPGTEKNRKDDERYFKGYAYQGDDLTTPKMKSDKHLAETLLGNTGWVAVRNKYFLAALVPAVPAVGATIGGSFIDGKPLYDVALIQQASITQSRVYLGPLELKRVQALGNSLEQVMTLGWAFIRPISRGVLYLLTAFHKLIPNYGFVLILFSILVKILLYPLTQKSYLSTQKMQALQPQIKDLKEKFKNDPARLNKAQMELYKETGVNPMGGCLPLVLQMPLLIALFQVFQSTIELRGEPFILWITDLSAPDTLMTIAGFPLNILPILMAITMIFQQTMMPTQPGQQKSMMYIMNVVFLFIFYRFPSGLNLYYTLFNALTILQQKYLMPKPAVAPVAVGTTKTEKRRRARKK